METKPESKPIHLGGSIEQATRGKTDLRAIPVLREAFQLTNKTFGAFLPAVVGYVLLQLVLILLFLEVQAGNALANLQALLSGGGTSESQVSAEFFNALMMAGQFADVVSAPLFLVLSLMAVNHAVGLPTRMKQMFGMLPKLIFMATMVTLFTISLQTLATTLFFPLGLFLTMAFGTTLLLICHKRLPLLTAVRYSIISAFRHLAPLTAVYVVIAGLFILSVMSMGVALIWVLPFYFNVRAIVYRTLFGVTLKVSGHDDSSGAGGEDNPKGRGLFEA